MKGPFFADENYDLWFVLGQATRAMRKARQRELNRQSATLRKSAVLAVMQANGGKATPAEISQWFILELNSVYELLVRMEREGLVRKVKHLGKRKMARIVSTEKGREVYYQSAKGKVIPKIIACLSEEEQQKLRLYLERLRDKAMEEMTSEHEIPSLSSK